MIRLVSLTMAAAAVVIGVHSGNVALALAALCGAGGVASLADDVVRGQQAVDARVDRVARTSSRAAGRL